METAAAAKNEAILSRDIHFGRVPWAGGGDADIHTKAGRSSIVEVKTSDLRNLGTHLSINVTYTVREVWSDHTTLSRTDTVVLQAPAGYSIEHAGTGRAHCQFTKSYPGQDHAWHDASGEVAGTFLGALAFRFDGRGRDDEGNAQMRARVEIPVVLKS